jgi:hypothetical protein
MCAGSGLLFPPPAVVGLWLAFNSCCHCLENTRFDLSASHGVLTSFGAVSNLYFLDLSVTSVLYVDAMDVCDDAVDGLEGFDRKERGEFAVDVDITLSRLLNVGCFGRATNSFWNLG